MELQDFKKQKNKSVLCSMIDYMKEVDDCGYTKKDIDKCGNIFDSYIDELLLCEKDETAIMNCVKKVVVSLNNLNKECNYSLIETGQREDLYLFIVNAAVVAGLPQPNGDITEEWREW
ncbi:hypothetical protein FACS1894142_8910 [Spirochaetia bacterium]|nr:hypothetical protein FACS1894142_8910 [Spirochaetia bacterium]